MLSPPYSGFDKVVVVVVVIAVFVIGVVLVLFSSMVKVTQSWPFHRFPMCWELKITLFVEFIIFLDSRVNQREIWLLFVVGKVTMYRLQGGVGSIDVWWWWWWWLWVFWWLRWQWTVVVVVLMSVVIAMDATMVVVSVDVMQLARNNQIHVEGW